MRTGFWVVMVVSMLLLVAGCGFGHDSGTNRATSVQNLHAISAALMVWDSQAALEGRKNSSPDSVAQLVTHGSLRPEKLANPRLGTAPANISNEEIAAARSDWRPIAQKLEGHLDYVVAFKGMNGNPGGMKVILAWEKPTGLSEGIYVLFGDMRVEFVKLADLPNVFELNNAAREKGRLPLIEMKDGLPVTP